MILKFDNVPFESKTKSARLFFKFFVFKIFSVALACACTPSASLARENRVALVIGNSNYLNVGRLENPPGDAAAVANALREADFQTVQVEMDLTRDKLVQALRRFEEKAEQADWALVYYAGHGLEVAGTNYLVPVDARLKSDRDISEEAVSLDQVLARLEGTRKLRLVILDACRDNPFLIKMKRTLSTRSVGRGLGRVEPDVGTLIAFSAKAGQTASDGNTGATNSPYAMALIKYLSTPNIEVDFFFRLVRADVLKATGREQDPATYGQLPAEKFVFRPEYEGLQPAAKEPQNVAALPPTALPPAEQDLRGGWIGIRVQQIDGIMAETLDLGDARGSLITGLVEGGPAKKAGLEIGDLIIGGPYCKCGTARDLLQHVSGLGPKEELALTVKRNKSEFIKIIKLGVSSKMMAIMPDDISRPSGLTDLERPQNPQKISLRSPFQGGIFVNTSREAAEELRVVFYKNGVAVQSAAENTQARRAGFKEGDVIISINKKKISSIEDFIRVIDNKSKSWEITINRDGEDLTSVFGN